MAATTGEKVRAFLDNTLISIVALGCSIGNAVAFPVFFQASGFGRRTNTKEGPTSQVSPSEQ